MTDKEIYDNAKQLMSGRKKDRKTAKNLLLTLPNYPPAQFLLAVLLNDNRKKICKKAMKLFTVAIPYYLSTTENDDVERQVRLAGYYYFGNMGIEKNIYEAFRWFNIAANNGDPHAQLFLAKCYALGNGTEKDMDKFFYWIEKAAEQNEPQALTTLGHIYATGQGVDQDLEKGVTFLKRAIGLGSKKAFKLYRCLILTKEIKE